MKKNCDTGKNPNTGKEFLLLDVANNGKLTKSGQSYQTRYGAVQNKKSGQIICLAENIAEKKAASIDAEKKRRQKIEYIQNKIADIKANPYDGAESVIKSLREQIDSIKRQRSYDWSGIS